MLRTYVNQLAIEAGRPQHPSEDDISRAIDMVTKDAQYRAANNLPSHTNHPFINDYIYDIETFPNLFTFSIRHYVTGRRWFFEISEWKNQGLELYAFLCQLRNLNARMVGFNNIGFDYPVIHLLCEYEGIIDHNTLYLKAQQIIGSMNTNRFAHMIWERDRFVTQVDLFLIHHFDNKAKMTSLKMLEFNMRSPNIKELPYDPNYKVDRNQADNLCVYNDHDVDETEKFYLESLPQIQFRESLSERYGKDFTNHNDTKIGKDYFLMELHKRGIQTKVAGKLIQTHRDNIPIGDVIFPYVNFEHPEFNRILNFFRTQSINGDQLKGFFKDVSANINGFSFDFGAGGIHGSMRKTIVRESDTHALIDIDVASYYPNLAIANNLYPEHLGEEFCKIYLDVYNQRKSFAKGTPENAMLKLALNGVYGASNDKYSPFLDPKYTLSITINGQLLLCMLAEQLMKIDGLTMVQINTDGLTYLCPREQVDFTMQLKEWWEKLTLLELERVDYKAMYIRDVNSYMAETLDGKIKRIGAYAHETALENPATREIPWNKNFSALVIPKAAEAALIRNENIEEFIRNHDDEYDFMLRTKVPRSSRLELHTPVMWGNHRVMSHKTVLQNISRYYVSETGGNLVKVMPPTATQIKHWNEGDHYQHEDTGEYQVTKPNESPKSGKFKPVDYRKPSPPEREIGIDVGYLVTDCSDMANYYDDKAPEINYNYYITEARKLVDELLL